MSDKIRDALKKLDVKNDDHWTADKKPRMDAIEALLDDKGVTRDQVNEAADGFTRDTAPGYWMSSTAKPWEQPAAPASKAHDVDGKPSGILTPGLTADSAEQHGLVTAGAEGDNVDVNDQPSGVPTPVAEGDVSLHAAPFNPEQSQQAAPGTAGTTGAESAAELTDSPRADGASGEGDTPEGGEGGPADLDGEAESSEVESGYDGPDEIEALEAALCEAEEELSFIRGKVNDAQKYLADKEAKADVLRERIERLRPRNSNTATIQAYLASQKQVLVERGEARQNLAAAGVNLKELVKGVSKSPIDMAMARKGGRGGNRPNRR